MKFDLYQFTPTADFESPEFKSAYIKDLVYTVRPRNDRLHAAVGKWIEEGKVRVIDASKSNKPSVKVTATVSGAGKVT